MLRNLLVKLCLADIVEKVHLEFDYFLHLIDAGRIDCIRLNPFRIFGKHLAALLIECKLNVA